MKSVKVRIERLPEGQNLPLPSYQTAGSSGLDVCAAVSGEVVVAPGEVRLIPAGFRIAVPPGYEAQVRPRSGLALKHGIAVLNAPGTIDSDYRGPVGIILANLGGEPFAVRRGDRIAQMVICPVARAEIEEVEQVPDTARGEGGFGHTGV